MRNRLEPVSESDRGYYSAKGFSGCALHIVGYPKVWESYTTFETDPETGKEYEVETDEGEFSENPDGPIVIVRMVGDDRDFEMHRSDLTRIKRADFCGGCGSIGCGCDAYDGEDE
jgi:hypothetical protein